MRLESMETLQDPAPSMRRCILAFAALVSLIAGACGGAASPSVPSPAAATPSPTTPSEIASPQAKLVVGGDRPVTVHVPASYDVNLPAPLVILLHGYTGYGLSTDGWFRLAPAADARGFVYAYPDGTIDSDGKRFWNATNACCNFDKSPVDDVAYLTGVIAEIQAKLTIDPKRIAFVGHSNGGFMSYRMACDQAGLVAAIVSLAGATFADPADCAPSEPVSVAQIHGTADDVIRYEGGGLTNGSYPAAEKTAEVWATYDGCGTASSPLDAKVDVDAILTDGADPAETSVTEWSGCRSGAAVQLWTIPGGGHAPEISSSFADSVLDFLVDHPKP
jgi:polyhydroxybutyrate depolymerase